jgi:hypothetical protein
MEASVNHKGKEVKFHFSNVALIRALKREGLTMTQIGDTSDGGGKMLGFLYAYIEVCLGRVGIVESEITQIMDTMGVEKEAELVGLAIKSIQDVGSVFSKAVGATEVVQEAAQ